MTSDVRLQSGRSRSQQRLSLRRLVVSEKALGDTLIETAPESRIELDKLKRKKRTNFPRPNGKICAAWQAPYCSPNGIGVPGGPCQNPVTTQRFFSRCMTYQHLNFSNSLVSVSNIQRFREMQPPFPEPPLSAHTKGKQQRATLAP